MSALSANCRILSHSPILGKMGGEDGYHKSVVINVKGNSYRLRDKIGKAAAETGQSEKTGGSLFTTENGSVLKDR
jgi:hypothetical protein